jgi:hypothetical protein
LIVCPVLDPGFVIFSFYSKLYLGMVVLLRGEVLPDSESGPVEAGKLPPMSPVSRWC